MSLGFVLLLAADSYSLRSATVSFVGHGTFGDFVGTTSTARGFVEASGSGARGWVEVPVATLATGNGQRDRDMRASLEAERYPTMRFDLASSNTVSSGTDQVILHGTLTIHGVQRVVDLPAKVSRGADEIHLMSEFPLDLADYHIGGLTKMFGLLRMQRQIEVRLDLRFAVDPPDDGA